MDHDSPIYTALVSQTEATIANLKRDLEAFYTGKVYIGGGSGDETPGWITRLEKWLADNERLLVMLSDGTI